MIVLNLRCERAHRFEGWFASTVKFDAQCREGLVTCPTCGSGPVSRLPSAPAIATSRATSGATSSPHSNPRHDTAARQQAARVLRALARQAEDVGARFPDVARDMHYGEIESRAIRGVASAREVVELLDEGISVIPLPASAAEDGH